KQPPSTSQTASRTSKREESMPFMMISPSVDAMRLSVFCVSDAGHAVVRSAIDSVPSTIDAVGQTGVERIRCSLFDGDAARAVRLCRYANAKGLATYPAGFRADRDE